MKFGVRFAARAPGVKQLGALLWNYRKNFYLYNGAAGLFPASNDCLPPFKIPKAPVYRGFVIFVHISLLWAINHFMH